MPIDVHAEVLFAGYNEHDVVEGEEATIITRRFVSSEDGELLNLMLDGINGMFLSRIPQERWEELLPVRSMVAIIKTDLTVTLYLDTIPGDINPIIHIRTKRDLESLDSVTLDDIADIVKIEYKGIDFPKDAGFAIVFPSNTNVGFFFDSTPLVGDRLPREYDLEKSLAGMMCYLTQKHLFNLDDSDRDYMFASGWFPFITLKADTRQQLIEQVKARSDLDDLLPVVTSDVKEHCVSLRARVKKHSLFASHATIIGYAIDKYLEGDYISSTALLYTRIEGVMRSLYKMSGASNKATQGALAAATVEARKDTNAPGIMLLPNVFRKYLEDVYFAGFDPNSVAKLSRNSIGHGVAEQEDYNEKSATIGLLIIDQISYFAPAEQPVDG